MYHLECSSSSSKKSIISMAEDAAAKITVYMKPFDSCLCWSGSFCQGSSCWSLVFFDMLMASCWGVTSSLSLTCTQALCTSCQCFTMNSIANSTLSFPFESVACPSSPSALYRSVGTELSPTAKCPVCSACWMKWFPDWKPLASQTQLARYLQHAGD